MGSEAVDGLVAAHPPAHDPEKHALGLRPDGYAAVVLSLTSAERICAEIMLKQVRWPSNLIS